MSTPTPRTKPIDLSKCKIGQRVKLRNGDIVTFMGAHTNSATYPFTAGGRYYQPNGRFLGSDEKSKLDIVALLPLPKKAGKPGKKKASPLDPGWVKGQGDKAAIRRVIKLLKGLLKP